jgi:hypothetical protein
MKVEERKIRLKDIAHKEGKLTFQYPAFRGNPLEIAEQIETERLKRPGSSETASLIYDAFKKPKEKYESEIIDILNNECFVEYTGILYLPKLTNKEIHTGVIIEHNPKMNRGKKLKMDEDDLIKRLQKNDPLVKFVPLGYKIGEQKSSELEQNPYIIARYGKEGAEKIAKIASKYREKPYLWGFDSSEKKIAKLPVLRRYKYFGDRLDIDHFLRDSEDCYAFGICNFEKNKPRFFL